MKKFSLLATVKNINTCHQEHRRAIQNFIPHAYDLPLMSQVNPYVIDSASESDATVTPSFRFAATRVLLTYAQCGDLTKEDVFFTIDERYPAQEWCLGEEIHADGGRHIHAVFYFKRKVQSRDPGLFDVSNGTNSYHPNIRPIKAGKAHFERSCEYVRKEDPAPLTNITPKLTWGEILETAATAEEYLALIRKHYPRDYAVNLQRYEYSAEKMFGRCPNTIKEDWTPGYEHTVPGPLAALEEGEPFTKTLVIVGPPGCGKTTWAKEHAPKPALFIRHLDSLAQFRPEHRSIIFDDLDFKHLPNSTQKYLVDYENLSEIHIRYKVARIPEGIPRVFTANEYPFTEDPIHGPAIDRRVNKIFL